jgi:hypothetical protein
MARGLCTVDISGKKMNGYASIVGLGGSTLELYGHTQSHVLAESFWIPLS